MDRKELKEKYKEMKPDMGVFAYTCVPTGKVYLGCGQNMKGDINSITFQLNIGNFFPAPNLQSDWKKYGENAFLIEVVEKLDYSEDDKADYKKELNLLRTLVSERFAVVENIR